MRKSWSIQIEIEHEWDQTTADCKGIAITEMKVTRVVDGDDEACDALWAAEQAVAHLRKLYKLEGPIHVKEIEIRECE